MEGTDFVPKPQGPIDPAAIEALIRCVLHDPGEYTPRNATPARWTSIVEPKASWEARAIMLGVVPVIEKSAQRTIVRWLYLEARRMDAESSRLENNHPHPHGGVHYGWLGHDGVAVHRHVADGRLQWEHQQREQDKARSIFTALAHLAVYGQDIFSEVGKAEGA